MGQIFPKSANVLARTTLILFVGGLTLVVGIAYAVNSSSLITREDIARDQPVPFSHKHHAGGMAIDCRYCHVHVDDAATAGIPPTHTCMTCHSQILSDAEVLEPVRESYENGVPLVWNRVHDLPDFVYFDHSIHVAKGIVCRDCHGDVEEMPLVWQNETLQMGWCLDCHRHPPETAQPGVAPSDDCYACHR